MEKQPNVMLKTLRSKLFGFFMGCLVMGIAIGLTPNVSFAQSDQPDAGTTIGNQATATYQDNGGNSRTVTSNTVETTVKQVAAVSITQGTTQQVAPGGQVLFPHTITNNGNGTDTFTLSTAEGSPSGGDFDFANILIFEDANGDGVPDDLNDPITQSDPVDRGDSYSFVVVAEVPTSPTTADGHEETIEVVAESQHNNNITAASSPVNKAIVSENAVVSVVKSQSTGTGDVGDTITITLQYTNTGNSDASNLVLRDEIPEGFDYVENSAMLMGTSVTDDDSDNDNFSFTDNGGTGTDLVEATVPTLSYNQQGTLTLKVKIAEGTEGEVINNTGTFIHEDLSGEQSTNTTTFTVNENHQVVTVDENGDANDVNTPETVTIANKEQGATVNFVNTFQNNGSTADRFNITWDENEENPFPNGRTITLYKTDGNGNPTSPLTTDSNGDGDPDIGPIDPGEQFEVVLQVQLPASGKGGPQSVDVTATSINDESAVAIFTDVLTEISANQVDMTNGTAAAGDGSAEGEGVETFADASANVAVNTKSTDPGTTTSFTLYINNTSGPSDNYNLVAGTNNAGNFSAGLPDGFSVQFQDPNNGNAVITNTGNISSGGNKKVTAVVSVASDAAPGTQDIYFRVRSSSSGAVDYKRDAVNVNAVRNLTLVANQSGQLAPGGSTTFLHTLTNEGNVVENEGTHSQLQLNLTNTIGNGWQAAVFYDADGSGTINNGDVQITTAGSSGSLYDDGDGDDIIGQLRSGDSVDFIVRVTTTPGVNTNNDNTTTLTVGDDGDGQAVNGVATSALTANVQDITTIVVGNLVIEKTQRNVTGSGSFTSGNVDADPGDIIEYRLVVTNQGQAPVTNINLTDNTPGFTTQKGSVAISGAATEDDIVSDPGDGNSGTVKVTVASLGAGQSFTIKFSVEIDK